MTSDIIKSYLVKLGVQIDDPSVNKLKEGLGQIQKLVKEYASSSTVQMSAGALAVVSALATIDAAIVATVKKVADADMSYQLLAQKMFMSVDAAKAFKIATDSMGKNLNEIAWNAELKGQYFTLVKQINELKTPPEARLMLKEVRAMGFEFTRLKTAGVTALEWITYYLLKMNRGEAAEMGKKLHDFISWIIDNIPIWTQSVAKFLQVPIQLTMSLFKVLKSVWTVVEGVGKTLYTVFKAIWDMIPEVGREFGVLAGILLVAFGTGSPILAGMAAISAFLVLVDDLMHYIEGKESSALLKPFWALADFIGYGLNNIIIAATVSMEHFWAAARGQKHESGKSWQDDLFDRWALLHQAQKEVENKRNLNRQSREKVGGVPTSFSGIDEFKEAIGQHETRGIKDPYSVRARHKRSDGSEYVAIGKYQILDSNWGPWAREAGLPADADPTPENQERVAGHKMAEYAARYGNNFQLMAIAWVGGPGKADTVKAGMLSSDPKKKAAATRALAVNTGVAGSSETVADYAAAITGARVSPEYMGVMGDLKRGTPAPPGPNSSAWDRYTGAFGGGPAGMVDLLKGGAPGVSDAQPAAAGDTYNISPVINVQGNPDPREIAESTTELIDRLLKQQRAAASAKMRQK